MGPRSENRGYPLHHALNIFAAQMLQWVHGPRTVVILKARRTSFPKLAKLQWVHGPRTVVIF